MNVKRTRTREFWLSVHCYKCMTTFATRTVHRRHAANSRRPTVAPGCGRNPPRRRSLATRPTQNCISDQGESLVARRRAIDIAA
ncbi:hypothetical protein M3J09_013860 [Ascochyta lentis]